MTEYWVQYKGSSRKEAGAPRPAIAIKLYGTVGDSDFLVPGIIKSSWDEQKAVFQDYPFGAGGEFFSLFSDKYLGDIYRIEIINSMNRSDHPWNPDLYLNKLYITNPDPSNHALRSSVVSCFNIGMWINEKDKVYPFEVSSGLDMETVKYMTEKMIYGTEFSVPPGLSREREIKEEYENEVSEKVTRNRRTKEMTDIDIKMKLTLFKAVTFDSNYKRTEVSEEEETNVSSDVENEKQVNTFTATITNDTNKVRTFQEAYIFRKNYSTVMLGNLLEDACYRTERVFAGIVETTPI